MLFEHASGYALFRAKEFEEISMLQPEVEASVTDLARFNAVVKLIAFSPFKSGTNALDNMNSISEGIMHEVRKIVPFLLLYFGGLSGRYNEDFTIYT